MATSYDTEIEVGGDVVAQAKPKPIYIFGVTFTDGYYSVRHAHDADHAIELSKERHPGRTVKTVEMKFPY